MKEKDVFTASEALYGFCGWLTSQPTPTTMSSKHDAAIVADKIKEYCDKYQLAEPRPDWANNI